VTALFTRTTTAANKTRTYFVDIPVGYNPNVALPFVFVIHHRNGTSAQAYSYGVQDAAQIEGKKAIFVYPQGILYAPANAVGWDLSATGYDVPFFQTMYDEMTADYCIDKNRVFATGFSWGSDMTNSLGCYWGDKLRAIAPASGGGPYQGGCVATAPAFRITYGDGDTSYSQSTFASTVQYYRQANGCGPASDPVSPSPCVLYQNCQKPVIECKYIGMGHAFPPGWGASTWDFLDTFQ